MRLSGGCQTVMIFLNRKLQALQLFWVFAALCLLFVLPLILADGLYLDDFARAQLADGHWLKEGRLLQELLYVVLTFSSGVPNIFPLPLLLATLVTADALSRLTRHYFAAPNIAHALVVLPLWFSPFFLQNLSYQYDGPGMALGLVAMIHAVTYRSCSRWRQLLLPGLLIAAGLAFYQLLINVLIGLYCIELLRAAHQSWPAASWYRCLRDKSIHLVVGLIIYYVAAWPWLKNSSRSAMLPLDRTTLENVRARLFEVANSLGLLVTDSNRWLCVLMAGGAVLCFGLLAVRIARQPVQRRQRLFLLILYLLTAPLLLVAVPGASLVFHDYAPGARLLTGLGPLLVAIFYLLHDGLQRLSKRLTLLLCVPLLCMLSFSFAYGRVLQVQRVQAERIALQLSMDIAANPDLERLSTFFLLDTWQSAPWLPAAYDTFRVLPALKFILGVYYLTLPEILPRYGVVNMSWPRENDPALYRPWPAPFINNRFYDIYIEGDTGYVVMKLLASSQQFMLFRE